MDFNEFCKRIRDAGGSVSGSPKSWKNNKFQLMGCNTHFEFHPNCKIESLSFTDYGGMNKIIVGENSKLTGNVKIGRSCEIKIGKNVTCTSGVNYHISEMTCISIGDGCMLGVGVSIYTHDYHPIFDINTGNRINKSRNVSIGNNVWIANQATILKGTVIGNNSVIGMNSVVSGLVKDSCISAGNPAKIIAENIIWDRASFNTTHPDGIKHKRDI